METIRKFEAESVFFRFLGKVESIGVLSKLDAIAKLASAFPEQEDKKVVAEAVDSFIDNVIVAEDKPNWVDMKHEVGAALDRWVTLDWQALAFCESFWSHIYLTSCCSQPRVQFHVNVWREAIFGNKPIAHLPEVTGVTDFASVDHVWLNLEHGAE